ncbi:hypothetical protein ACFL09_06260, partial [Planctomycetota bacterium]
EHEHDDEHEHDLRARRDTPRTGARLLWGTLLDLSASGRYGVATLCAVVHGDLGLGGDHGADDDTLGTRDVGGSLRMRIREDLERRPNWGNRDGA